MTFCICRKMLSLPSGLKKVLTIYVVRPIFMVKPVGRFTSSSESYGNGRIAAISDSLSCLRSALISPPPGTAASA